MFKDHSEESVRVGKGMGDYIAVYNEVPNDNRKLVVYNDDDSISFAPKICDNISLQRMSVSEVKNWLEWLFSSKGSSKEVQLYIVNSEEPIYVAEGREILFLLTMRSLMMITS